MLGAQCRNSDRGPQQCPNHIPLCCGTSGTEDDQANSDPVPHPVSPAELGSAGQYSAKCPQSLWISAAFVISSSNCWENGGQQSLEAGQFNWCNTVSKVVNSTSPDWFLHPWQSTGQKVQLWRTGRSYFYFFLISLTCSLVWLFFPPNISNKALFSLSCDKMVFA